MKTQLAIRFGLAAAVWFAGHVTSPAATFTVTNVFDSGPGSLREAITSANANGFANPDTIEFNIPGSGPHRIQPTSALPALTSKVTIDGFTQSNSNPNTLANGNDAHLMIELNGSLAPSFADGLAINGSSNAIRGLVINGWARNGILHNIGGASPFNSWLRIEGCFIGTDVTGSNILANQLSGIFLKNVANCTIGGVTTAARNVISGNGAEGVLLDNDLNNTIQGNFIGTDKSGTAALGNGLNGIRADFGSTNNIVGGGVPGAGNVISGNGSAGMELATVNAFVQGNRIGTDVTGANLIGNINQGVSVYFGNNIVIGGTNSGEGNVIAGNGGDGVFVIGEDEGGPIGGVGDAILGNSIYNNGTGGGTDQIGIDLYGGEDFPFGAGVSPNDDCDSDFDGGNRFQNFPVLMSSVSDSSSVTISGFLNSTPSTAYLLEFFATDQRSSSGECEGKTFLGRTELVAGAGCSNSFMVTLPLAVADGMLITATASRILGGGSYETSEFSQCLTNVGTAAPSVVTIISTLTQGNDVIITWTGPGGATHFVQSAPTVNGVFTNISQAIMLSPGSEVTTNYHDIGTLTNDLIRFYRIQAQN